MQQLTVVCAKVVCFANLISSTSLQCNIFTWRCWSKKLYVYYF